jgi:DNA-binding transcriptional ArsR family regulator
MVERELDAIFAALSDPTRRAIVERLAAGEASVSDLAEPFDMSLAGVSKHVGVLARAGLVDHGKRGRVRYCRLAPEPLRAADDWLARYRVFWHTRLEALAAHLARPK